jgi:outer membrane immunogenic protein
MRTIAILASLAAMSATPAMAAGEARVEARGGIAFANGSSEGVAGVAAGYDFDLGGTAFAGIEGTADKILESGTGVVFGVGPRLGIKAGDKTRLYANGGIAFGSKGGSDPYLGAGIQRKLGTSVFGKIEYRRFLSNGSDVNLASIGLGLTF